MQVLPSLFKKRNNFLVVNGEKVRACVWVGVLFPQNYSNRCERACAYVSRFPRMHHRLARVPKLGKPIHLPLMLHTLPTLEAMFVACMSFGINATRYLRRGLGSRGKAKIAIVYPSIVEDRKQGSRLSLEIRGSITKWQ